MLSAITPVWNQKGERYQQIIERSTDFTQPSRMRSVIVSTYKYTNFNTTVTVILNSQRHNIDGIKPWIRTQLASAFCKYLSSGKKYQEIILPCLVSQATLLGTR
jgi:hypothetical protein